MASITQFNFSGGEITPELHGNTGFDKYRTSLKTLTNVTVKKSGGLQNRPGTEFISEVFDSTRTVRLVPFIFSDSQTYVLEFGHQTLRIVKQGVLLKLASQNITAISNANPCVITYAGADTYSNGDIVYISGITGAIGTYLNNRSFKVGTVNAGANTFPIKYRSGTDVDSTSFGSYSSGGIIEEEYYITTDYSESDLDALQFSQSGDIITITHQSYAPRELSRTGDTSWSFAITVFDSDTSKPTNITQSGSAFAANPNGVYKVTAVDATTGEESTPGFWGTGRAITAITRAAPGVVTSNAHGFVNTEIYLTGINGMIQLNTRRFIAASTGANTFTLRDDYGLGGNLDTSSYSTYTSGGTAYIVGGYDGTLERASTSTPITISWTRPTARIVYFKIYKMNSNLYGTFAFGLIGTSDGYQFVDNGITPDFTQQPPELRNPFIDSGNYPKTVAHAQQRIFYANTINNPETFWGSKTGCYHNFITRSTISDGDPVTGTLANRKVNQINHLVDLERLVCLLAGSEVTLNGSQSGFVTPEEVNAKTQSYNGSSDLRPVLMDESVLYIQNRGSYIRELSFVGETYAGTDLSLFAKHLFEGYTITDWSFQENPDSIIWAVRSDGVLLSLTYVKAQNIIAWAKHTFRYGIVENVCVVPHGTEDKVYLIIKRTISNRTTRYIEALTNRFIDDIKDNIFMDSSLSLDGRNTASTTMTLSGSGWTYLDTLTLTASAGTFLSNDVRNEIHITGSDGTLIRCEITAYTSPTVVSVRPDRTVPASMQAVAISTWSKAVDDISGLWHLEGKPVSVLGDGFVVASPYNSDYSTLTVANGAITLPRPYAVVHVGLPYISDIETLDIDAPNIQTLSTKKILITEVTARVYKTKGVWFGREAPSDDETDALEGLTELKLRSNESMDDPVALKTGVIDTIIETKWSEGGRVFIRQVDPLPLTLISLTPSGIIPAGG